MLQAASTLSPRRRWRNRRCLRRRSSGRSFIYNLRYPGQYALPESGLNYNYFRDYDPQSGRYLESDPIGLQGGSYSTYAYASGNPISRIDPLGLYGGVIAAGNTGLGNNVSPIFQTRLPDYVTLQLDLYVYSVSATYTVYGDIFLGQGASRQYWNPANLGVSISNGWMMNSTGCGGTPPRSQLNNFLNSWSGSVGGYDLVGGSYSFNASGQGLNLGVGLGGVGVSPGIINTYQGNVFGEP